MKNVLLGAAATLAIAAPSVAHADVTGHLDLAYQQAKLDFGSNEDVNAWNLGGAVIMPMQDNWNLQFDANAENYNWGHSHYDSSVSNVTVHGDYRNDSYALGAYGGFGSIYSQTLYMAGVEGQFYLPNMTFAGAISHGQTSNGYDEKAWDYRVNGSYFFNDNFDLNATVSYTDFDHGDTTATGYGIGVDYRFSNCPWTISGNYLHEDWDYGSDVDGNLLKVSLRYSFGTHSALDESQHGASFDAASRFTDVWTRWD